jgi:CAAX protease family protein
MDDITPGTPQKSFPFNNLYLLSGLVHGFNKGWMYLFTIVFLMLGYVLFQSISVLPLMAILLKNGYTELEVLSNANLLFDANALKIDRNIVLALELGMFVFAAIGFYIGIRFLHRKTLTSVLTGYEKFRFGRFWFAFGVWTTFLVVSVLINYIFFPDELVLNFNLQGFLISTLIMVLMMPIQTGLEEVVFRGYFLQGLGQVFKNGIVPLILTSFLFGAAHMSNPEVKEFGWPIMLTYYTSFALFMGCLTLLDEGLELAFGIHFANNIISSILLNSPSSVIKTYSVFEVKKEAPASEIVVWLCMATLAFFIFWAKYRWKNFKLIIK